MYLKALAEHIKHYYNEEAFWHSALCSDQPFFRQSGPQNDTDLYTVNIEVGEKPMRNGSIQRHE